MNFKIFALITFVALAGFSSKIKAQDDSEIIPESTEYPMPPNGMTAPPPLIDESDSGPTSDVDDFQE